MEWFEAANMMILNIIAIHIFVTRIAVER